MKLQLFVIFSITIQLDATLLFWSNKNIKIPSLKYFKEEDFENLLSELKDPQIIAFQNDYSTVDNIPRSLDNFYSAYVPNGNIYVENVTELTEDINNNLKMIEDSIRSFNVDNRNLKNMLIIISLPNIRAKRQTSNIQPVNMPNEEKSNNQVLYYNKDHSNGIAMIYSSRFIILKTSSDNYTLKDAQGGTLGNYGSYSVLSLTFLLEKSITLKFRFENSWGYWTLPSVLVEGADAKSVILNSSKTIRAESNFSYHCFGATVFKDNYMELTLYDIQVQPYAKIRKFSEAYDCVPFTTVPIWSGLMVSFTLILGLFLGFGALASIKTMDKFDTSKTKQLSFTVTE